MAAAGTVLIVDDEEIVREFLADLLSDTGCHAVTAENGFVALELFRNPDARFDLVMLDMCMPGMSGAEVCKEIRKINPDQKIIIASGSYATDEEIDELKKNGVTTFIRKPFNMGELLSLVESLVSRSSSGQD